MVHRSTAAGPRTIAGPPGSPAPSSWSLLGSGRSATYPTLAGSLPSGSAATGTPRPSTYRRTCSWSRLPTALAQVFCAAWIARRRRFSVSRSRSASASRARCSASAALAGSIVNPSPFPGTASPANSATRRSAVGKSTLSTFSTRLNTSPPPHVLLQNHRCFRTLIRKLGLWSSCSGHSPSSSPLVARLS